MTAGQQTFPRSLRLTGPEEFRRVFSRPTVSTDRCFRVLWRRNALERPRLGLAVSRKTCPKAVGRNRLKRLVRESFRRHQVDLAREGGVDIVVLPSRYAVTQCNEALGASLERHWQRCGVKRNAGDANKTEKH